MKANALSLVFNVLTCIGIILVAGCRPSEKPSTQAARLIQNAGGVDIINKEAKAILAKLGNADEKLLSSSDLKEYPAISSLGNVVLACNQAPGFPANVRIRFGRHNNINFILVFDPADTKGPDDKSSLEQIAPNIFVTGKR